MSTELETGIDWGSKVNASVITYHFAQGGSYNGVFAYNWTAYEIQQFQLAFDLFSSFLDVTFAEASTGQHLTLVRGDAGDVGALGYFYPPGYTTNAGIGAFNWQGAGWDWDSPGTGALEQGGYGFVTIIHELGHGFGLAHPHDTGGSSTVFPGVSTPFDDYGNFNLNQGVYTMMSYNDGWQTSPDGMPPPVSAYGYEGTPWQSTLPCSRQNMALI